MVKVLNNLHNNNIVYIYMYIYIFIIIYIYNLHQCQERGRGYDCTKKPLLKLRLHGNGPHDKNANQEDIKNIEPIMKSLLHLFWVASGYVLLKTDSPFQHIM